MLDTRCYGDARSGGRHCASVINSVILWNKLKKKTFVDVKVECACRYGFRLENITKLVVFFNEDQMTEI